MRHARNRFPWHRIHAATAAVALAAALAACGTGAGAAPATLSAAPSEAAIATTGNSTPEPSASPSSVTIASTAYPYAWTFPADVVTSAPTLARSELGRVEPVRRPGSVHGLDRGGRHPDGRRPVGVGVRYADDPDPRRVRHRRPAANRRVAPLSRRTVNDAGRRSRRCAGEAPRIRVHVRGRQRSPPAGVRHPRRDRDGDRDGEAQRR